ncbi:MAG: hypothetical protein A3G40_09865 [Deltaproteobacteria bacterium RIFCSPLOWO2_12_FULL_57_22]|nr:MAG: hypothetical protein A3G40_09865 [Deltaproteobacteria bacterium RIFCSPLOWO2_12_FULL_57_22]
MVGGRQAFVSRLPAPGVAFLTILRVLMAAQILPYVIDNQAYRMADILKDLLAEHKGRSLDVAIAYSRPCVPRDLKNPPELW